MPELTAALTEMPADVFVKQMAKHTKFHKQVLTPAEQKQQDEIASPIIDEILN